MAVSLNIWNSRGLILVLTSPHHISPYLTLSVTILLSFGDLPVFYPDDATKAPESAILDFLVSGSAGG